MNRRLFLSTVALALTAPRSGVSQAIGLTTEETKQEEAQYATIACRLSNATGLNFVAAETHSFGWVNGSEVVAKLPAGTDVERFSDAFVAIRNLAGVTKEELPIRTNGIVVKVNNADLGTELVHLRDNPKLLEQIEAHSQQFRSLLGPDTPQPKLQACPAAANTKR